MRRERNGFAEWLWARCYRGGLLVALLGALSLWISPAHAQNPIDDPLHRMGFDQRLDGQVPLDLTFVNEMGTEVRLSDYFSAGHPVVLAMGYYQCPVLCSMVRSGMAQGLSGVSLTAGSDFTVVNVSIDPRETPMIAAAEKTAVVQRYGRPESAEGWHFLVGEQPAIDTLAEAIGFRYYYDQNLDQYGHPSGLVILTPEGRIARYFYGIEYNPTDLRLGLVEASQGKIGNPIDQFMLFCYQYDPTTGRYTMLVMNIVRAAGALTVLAVGSVLLIVWRRSGQGPAQAAV